MQDEARRRAQLVHELAVLCQRVAEVEGVEAGVLQMAGEASQVDLQRLLASNPAVLYKCAIEGQTFTPVYVSENLREYFGYETRDCLGNPRWWADHLHPEDRDRVFATFPAALFEQRRYAHEYRFQRQDGAYRWIHDRMNLERDEAGQPAAMVGSWLDITARKQTEEALRQAQRFELIGQLAAGVAHEINNPLTLVMGYAQLLLKNELDPAVRRGVETIHQGGQRAAAIAARLLTFARRQQLARHPQDLNAVVREVMELVRYSFEAYHVQLSEELAAGLPRVDIHAGQLQQLLLSLLQNSREAILKVNQEGVVRVRTRIQEGQVLLEVEDDGPGIPPEVQERIFDPFFTTKKVGQGPGLGLSECLGIARDHDGHLRVEPGASGACLVLELPAATARPPGTGHGCERDQEEEPADGRA